MNCCQCQGLESLFDQKTAVRELRHYRKKGADKTTQILIDALRANGVSDLTLIDIGGGVGAIQHKLFKAGIRQAIHVDASSAYLRVSQQEAERLGHAGQMTYRFGNFVDIAPELEPADIVTLDRVVCCYHDIDALVDSASKLATRYVGLVYPRETWWLQIGRRLINGFFWAQRNSFRFFVHATLSIDSILNQRGFRRQFHYRTFFWQVAVYTRTVS